MKSAILLVIAFMLVGINAHAVATKGPIENPKVLLETNLGNIEVELFLDKAPITVKNFLKYADSGLYNGTIFHRVIDSFMIQGGGFDTKLQQKKTFAPIQNEADNGLKNSAGTIAMARTSEVNSATNQFFINVSDNAFLDHKSKNPQGYGYAVFGIVKKGMSVVNQIKKTRTKKVGMYENMPDQEIKIIKVKRI